MICALAWKRVVGVHSSSSDLCTMACFLFCVSCSWFPPHSATGGIIATLLGNIHVDQVNGSFRKVFHSSDPFTVTCFHQHSSSLHLANVLSHAARKAPVRRRSIIRVSRGSVMCAMLALTCFQCAINCVDSGCVNDFQLLNCLLPAAEVPHALQQKFIGASAAVSSKSQLCSSDLCHSSISLCLSCPGIGSRSRAACLPAPSSSSVSPTCAANWPVPTACTSRASFFKEIPGSLSLTSHCLSGSLLFTENHYV